MANDRSTVRERRGFCVTWRETEGSLTVYMCRTIVRSSAVGGLFISLIFLHYVTDNDPFGEFMCQWGTIRFTSKSAAKDEHF